MKSPYIIEFQHTGCKETGFLDIAEQKIQFSFDIKRLFWSHDVPNGVYRGYHAHKATEQILIAIKGKIVVTTEMPNGLIENFELNSSTQGIYLPPNVWHYMHYTENAVQLVMCSQLYNEEDYLRDYEGFKNYYKL